MNIIDENKVLIMQHVGLEHEEQYNICALWALGTYFLKHAPKMKVARYFGMLGFVAPEEDTGKSTALNTIARLSYNPMSRGKKTIPAILDKIHKAEDKMTVPLDELHKKLGKDDNFDDFFNLGYEWDATIERKNREGEGQKETSAYCPKVFAAMSHNDIASDTASRCIMNYLYPRTDYTGDMDISALEAQNKKNLEWSRQVDTVEALEGVELEEDDIAFMVNRKRQIFRLMLAIAKTISEEWYQQALKAVKYFVQDEDRERSMGHKVILALYRIKELKLYDKEFYVENKNKDIKSGDEFFIWSSPMMKLLHANGIPDYIKDTTVAKLLKAYDPKIKSSQIKKDGENLNGYYWRLFDKAFRFVTIREKAEITKELSTLSTAPTPITLSSLSNASTTTT